MNYHEMIAKGFQGEPYSLFFHQWMWMGFGAAIVLLIFIFFTKYLRGDTTTPRMKDPAVLAWLGAVAYMLHNMEEYGVDLYGKPSPFLRSCTNLWVSASASLHIWPVTSVWCGL
ncbi:MAG: hypothetical protein IJP72_05225 [Bacteroidales bacterium]|nr:hypothetical protein [Bacteroidales bacterium]